MNLMMSEFTIDKESLRKNFYSEKLTPQSKWFFQNYQGTSKKSIQEKFYEFLNKVKQNIIFFDWFHAYSVINGIDYPWKTNLSEKTLDVLWHLKDNETVQSDLRPDTKFQLQNAKDTHGKPIMASPFKTRKDDEALNPRDIKSLMEQSNYTNKYLQTLGNKLLTKSIKIKEEPFSCKIISQKQVVKRLFKPFKVSKALSPQPKSISSQEEFLKKIIEKLKLLKTTVPDTPQQESSKTSSRVVINTLEKSNSESNHSEESEDDKIYQVTTQNWRKSSKLYSQHATPPNLLLEEKFLRNNC